jgi:hypothetical protein
MYAKFENIEQFLEIDNKIVEHKNATTKGSYAKSGTLHEYYSPNMQPSGDGYYYMPASQDLINLGIFEGVEITNEKYETDINDSSTFPLSE